MASLTNAHPSAGVRGLLAVLLHRSQRSARMEKPSKRERRHYPAKRDKLIEDAAMAREMFRL